MLVVAAYPPALLHWLDRCLDYVAAAGAADLLGALGHTTTSRAYAALSRPAKALLGALLAWAIVLSDDPTAAVPIETCTRFPWPADVMAATWREVLQAGFITEGDATSGGRKVPAPSAAAGAGAASGAGARFNAPGAAGSSAAVGFKRSRYDGTSMDDQLFFRLTAHGSTAAATTLETAAVGVGSKRSRRHEPVAVASMASCAPAVRAEHKSTSQTTARNDSAQTILFLGDAWSGHGFRPSTALQQMASDVLSLALARHPP